MSRGMHLGNIAKETVAAPIQAAYDGKYVWVTGSGNTQVFEVWANNTDDMGVNISTRKTVKVADVTDIATGVVLPSERTNITNCSFITYGGGYMWIAMKKDWTGSCVTGRSTMLYDCILKVNRRTRQVVDVIRTPISDAHKVKTNLQYGHLTHEYIMMNSVLHYAYGKLWMVEDYVDAIGSSQRIWIYDTTTSTWTSKTFNGKTQKNRAQITSANGYVYFAAYNSLSVLKHDGGTGNYISSIRGNANPNAMVAQPDGRILVTSYKGLISHLNTDDTWNHDLQVDTDECTGIAYESNSYCWVVDGANHLFRVGSDNYVYGSGYKDENGQDTDYTLLTANTMLDMTDKNSDGELIMWNKDVLAYQGDMVDTNYNTLNKYSFSGNIDYVLFIPSITYQYWNGTAMANITQPGLLVVLTDSEVVVINTSEIKFGFPRPAISRSTMSAVGVGMISYGPNDYLGD
jgi:hypothetical protein